ncbi:MULTISPECIES: ATP-grasp domain-containing protein [Lachnospiraceae]|uniref:ATP-grasp domain-containing protein n=1 Tax=Faecalicatena acetigenes TaxID=2981790 RepID=A0ABT2TCM9_9FIRM|nr:MULTISPECIES: ATP-grasp domain-containing protein [Lachnospiraceae]MCU6747771.1 ATP-grasp domain-containing protein [Faecalicatena acetigenes]SCI08262.1 Alanine-anticapsin ligase BacD [uncultured Clostridium sp.]
MKQKIVIIGANSFQNRLILRAKELGYETHVFAWKCGDIGERTADYYYPLDITKKEEILEVCREIRPAAVLSIASDLAVLTVNYVARNLNLPANPEICDLIATNKYEMRKALQEGGLSTPKFAKVKADENKLPEELKYPVIVKPTDRSGSRGITKVSQREGIEKALISATRESFEKAAIVEEFLEGKEYSCECISFEGKHQFLAFTEKFTTGAPHYIEIGHIQPADIPENMQEKIKQIVFAALEALKIQNGATHTEFKIDKQGVVRIIEIGARMGGDCIGSDLVQLSTGQDYMKMVIDVAQGNVPVFQKKTYKKYAAIRFIMQQSDLEIFEKIKERKEFSVVLSEIDKETIGKKVSDSSSRHGYFIVAGENYKELKKALFGVIHE